MAKKKTKKAALPRKLTNELVEWVCDQLVDSVKAAEMLGVTQTSVHRWCRNGQIFSVKIGDPEGKGGLLLKREDVENFQFPPRGRPRGS